MSLNVFKNGSAWLKFDCHLHTRADKEFKYIQSAGNVQKGYPPERTFVSDYVDALKKAGIHIGVITNHNKFDRNEFCALAKKAKKEQIVLLPGIELSVNEGANGVHTLVVFSDAWLADGADFIRQFLSIAFAGKNEVEYQNENGRTVKNLSTVIEGLNTFQKDYFIIFAHVEQASGLWHECAGGKLSDWAGDAYTSIRERTLAFQKVRTAEKRQQVQQWLGGWYPAEVEGSDCKKLEEIGTKAGECWLKVGELSYSAVKYALQDYRERVRPSAPGGISHSYIRSMAFEGGALDGMEVAFSSELNTLIGIRGSGKSSILEALRYGLGMKMPAGTSDREYKNSLIPYVLGSGGVVRIEAVDCYGQPFAIRRILNNAPVVYAGTAARPGISICETVIRNPLYFGQKELSAGGEHFGTDLVDKLIGNKLADIHVRIGLQDQKVHELVFSLQKSANAGGQLDEYQKRLADAEYNLKKFSDAGIEEKLRAQTGCDADDQWISSLLVQLRQFQSSLRELLAEFEAGLAEQMAYVSPYNQEGIGEIQRAVSEISAVVKRIKKDSLAIQGQLDVIVERQQEFISQKQQSEEAFARVRRELEAELRSEGNIALSIEDFKSLNIKIAKAREMIAALKKQQENATVRHSELLKALADLNDLHHQEFKIIEAELSKINSSDTSLTLQCDFKGDKAEFLRMMKGTFRGCGLKESAYQEIAERQVDFASIYADNEFRGAKNTTSYQNFWNMFHQHLAELLTYRVPDKITIRYQGKELQQHSLGQRASALILFILSRKESDVIIIDQPEDDLDNQTIYNDVICLLKKVKPDVQCIFATHNANFPVLGDAEMVAACSYSDGKIMVDAGNIDMMETQRQVVTIMEGGKDAFERRKEIYSSWKL